MTESASTRPPADDCWWLTPAERRVIEPDLAALSTWHAAPAQAIAARSACSIAVTGTNPLVEQILHALESAHLQISTMKSAEVVIVTVDACLDTWTLPADIQDRVHLPVHAHPGSSRVGPVVVPGRTACLRCWSLHRQDALGEDVIDLDRDLRVDPLVAMVTAAATASLLRHWIDAPEESSGRVLEFCVPDLTPRTQHISPHPACGCLWQAPANWGATGEGRRPQ